MRHVIWYPHLLLDGGLVRLEPQGSEVRLAVRHPAPHLQVTAIIWTIYSKDFLHNFLSFHFSQRVSYVSRSELTLKAMALWHPFKLHQGHKWPLGGWWWGGMQGFIWPWWKKEADSTESYLHLMSPNLIKSLSKSNCLSDKDPVPIIYVCCRI